jgi:Tol biopolymer transport system component
VQINAYPIAGTQGFRISPDGSRVAYLGVSTPGVYELYSVPMTGTLTDSVKISGPLVENGSVQYYDGFRFSPDGSRVVYRADADTDWLIELYVTDAGHIAPPPAFEVFLPLLRR